MHKISKNGIYFIAIFFSSIMCSAMESTQKTDLDNNNNSAAATYAASQRVPHHVNVQTQQEPIRNSEPRNVNILSIDGGGIRGLIPAQILRHFEQKLKRKIKERNVNFHGEISLARLFNLMVGTSTGGIIALGLNVPDDDDPLCAKYQSSDLVKLYEKFGNKVFPPDDRMGLIGNLRNSKYAPDGLEEVLETYFGDKFLNETVGKVAITGYEMRREELYLFETDKAREDDSENFGLKYVARSSSAAPTYLTAANIKDKSGDAHLFADGGIIANNPAMIAYMRAKTLFPHDNITLLSLGTGECRHDNLSNINEGKLGWGPVIANVMMDGTSKLNDFMLKEIAQSSSGKFNYVRIQPKLSEERSELDTVSANNISYLRAIAKNLWREHEATLSQLIDKLVKVYEANPHCKVAVSNALKVLKDKNRGSGNSVESIPRIIPERSLDLVPNFPSSQETKNKSFVVRGLAPIVRSLAQVGRVAIGATKLLTHIATTGKFGNLPSLVVTPITNIQGIDQRQAQNGPENNLPRIVSETPNYKKLTVVLLPHKNLTDDNLAYVARELLPSVKKLNLRSNHITSRGINHIKHLTSLEKLDISENPIKDRGAKKIAQFFPNLVFLDVSSTGLTDKGISVILASKLKALRIDNRKKCPKNLENIISSDSIAQYKLLLLRMEGLKFTYDDDAEEVNDDHKVDNSQENMLLWNTLFNQSF